MASVRVLLVDDSSEFLEAAEQFLQSERDFVVVGRATSVPEALHKVDSLRPDVVLMEIAMGGDNGLDATRSLKARAETPRVILLSMYESAEYRSAAGEAGADGFVGKWEFVERVISAINSAM